MAAETFDNRDGWIWMDGHMVNWRDAKVHVLTHALHYASAVFEGERAYVRAIAWRGSEMMGVSAQHNTIHLGIAVWEWPSYFDPAQRMKGIRLDIAHYRRPDPATP